jgi:hypothetical protein
MSFVRIAENILNKLTIIYLTTNYIYKNMIISGLSVIGHEDSSRSIIAQSQFFKRSIIYSLMLFYIHISFCKFFTILFYEKKINLLTSSHRNAFNKMQNDCLSKS